MINFRKIAWNKVGCSLYDLQDLLKEVYEQGRKDLLEEQEKQKQIQAEQNQKDFVESIKNLEKEE